MQNWQVVGADRETGENTTIFVEAGDEAQARRRANRRGIMVEDLRPEPATASSAAAPAIERPASAKVPAEPVKPRPSFRMLNFWCSIIVGLAWVELAAALAILVLFAAASLGGDGPASLRAAAMGAGYGTAVLLLIVAAPMAILGYLGRAVAQHVEAHWPAA